MTVSVVSPHEVFSTCKKYAKDCNWLWEMEDGSGCFYLPDGFGVDSIHVHPHPVGIVVGTRIMMGVPTGFEGVVVELQDLTDGRLMFHDTEGFIWNETYAYDRFSSRESMDEIFALLQREAAIAHALIDLYKKEGSINSCDKLMRLSLTGEVDICC